MSLLFQTNVTNIQQKTVAYNKTVTMLLGISCLWCLIVYRHEHSHSLPDIQYAFDAASHHDWVHAPENATAANNEPLVYYDAINVRPIVLKPKSRGKVLLNATDPVWGPPLLFPGYFTDVTDLEVIVAGELSLCV